MHDAAALLYPQALATSITLPMEIMHAASQMASVSGRSAAAVRFRLAGPDMKRMKLGSGVVLKPDIVRDDLPLHRGAALGPLLVAVDEGALARVAEA